MRNKLFSSIIISLILQIFLFNLTLGWTFALQENFRLESIVIILITLAILLLMTILYFFRNNAIKCPKSINKIYNFFFINIGKFKINQKIFFISTWIISGLVMMWSSSFTLYLTFDLIYQVAISNLTIYMLLVLGLVNLALFITGSIWIIVIFRKSFEFYKDARFAFLLMPFFGWIYFFTYQSTKSKISI
ncbi:hypothetical protein SSABA_v1c04410 [Spiroplasma sabaudiense Ar-1343]|uniref:Transmembrane protein n=1 Tax=Spiroplasma sabaudiense Ar-1343 TaxID=1276257 RepID=W6A9M0_9MOLU|nr:hypothetical protein SSABA_v1c04410 [Spiroplasma sabaudiense Ar-1343]